MTHNVLDDFIYFMRINCICEINYCVRLCEINGLNGY